MSSVTDDGELVEFSQAHGCLIDTIEEMSGKVIIWSDLGTIYERLLYGFQARLIHSQLLW